MWKSVDFSPVLPRLTLPSKPEGPRVNLPSNVDEAVDTDLYVPSPAPVEPPQGKVTLAQAIEAAVAQDPDMAKAHWGLIVQDNSGKVLYQRDANKMFTPASNMKLVTAAAATAALGADARFKTRLATDGSIDADGVLRGNLYLVGGGDPSLATADLQAAVANLPMRRIEGRVVVDDRVFDDVRLGRGWAVDDLPAAYSAEIDGLTLDENTARVRVNTGGVMVTPDSGGYLTFENNARTGNATRLDVERVLGTNVITIDGTVAASDPLVVAVSVHDPALYAGNVLASLCRGKGIEVTGGVARGAVASNARTLWEKSSEPLAALEKHMLKESDNLYAETLFRALAGGQSASAPDRERELLGLGDANRIVDGSGLSRADLLSPATLSAVVQGSYRNPSLRDGLPVAGVDGTLKNRMRPLKGRVQAKTGTLGGVSSLAGWLTLKDGRQVSFAWIVNGYPGAIGVAKRTEDQVIQAVDSTLAP